VNERDCTTQTSVDPGYGRRTALRRIAIGSAAAMLAGPGTERTLAQEAASPTAGPAAAGGAASKVIFVLQRRADLTREQMLAEWGGERHLAYVRKLPGLVRFVQNHVVSAPSEPAVCDGVGELWFASDAAMEEALSSPEFGAGIESATRFLDMERTGLVIVEERTVIG
jgi:uncharacterized protein (TIGR02118 family)